MKFFRKRPGTLPAEPGPASPAEAALITYARAHLSSPGAHALLDEVERGIRRRQNHDGPLLPASRHRHQEQDALMTSPPAPREHDGPLHAHEITPADAAIIRMMAGSHWGPDARMTLPSGKTITGDEMQRWIDALAAPNDNP